MIITYCFFKFCKNPHKLGLYVFLLCLFFAPELLNTFLKEK